MLAWAPGHGVQGGYSPMKPPLYRPVRSPVREMSTLSPRHRNQPASRQCARRLDSRRAARQTRLGEWRYDETCPDRFESPRQCHQVLEPMAAQLPFFATFARRMPASSCATWARVSMQSISRQCSNLIRKSHRPTVNSGQASASVLPWPKSSCICMAEPSLREALGPAAGRSSSSFCRCTPWPSRLDAQRCRLAFGTSGA